MFTLPKISINVWRFSIYDIFGKLIAEYGGLQATDEGGVKYVLQDWQGSTRAVVGNTGNVQSRSDYTVFGERVDSSVGLRSSTQGFGKSASLRQGYALTEKDDATGLDHTWFRKHENQAGRWTSPDPYNGSASVEMPQDWNRYNYVRNQPVNFVDPSGLNLEAPGDGGYCVRYHYTNLTGTISFWGPWTCYGGGDGGAGGGGSAGNNSGETQIDKEVLAKCLDEIYGLKLGLFRQGDKKFDGVISNSGGQLKDSQVFYLNVTDFSFEDLEKIFETGLTGILSLPPGLVSIHDNASQGFFVAERYGGKGGYHLQGITMYIANDSLDLPTAQITAIAQYLESQQIPSNGVTSLYSCIRSNNGFKKEEN